MTELEKIAYTKSFIDKMAEGINPLDDTRIPDGDLINHVRISRCLFFVSDVLRRICENGGIRPSASQKRKKNPLVIKWETVENEILSPAPLPISEFAKRVNRVADERGMERIKYTLVLKWLVENGFLEYRIADNGKRAKYPTEAGQEIGITTIKRIRYNREYDQVVYTTEAQAFLADHFIQVEPMTENVENVGKK